MPIGIAGQSYLNVTIDGKQLPLEQMRFQRLLLTSHFLYHMPMGELVFLDPYDIVATNLTTADGTLIQIDAGKDQDRVYRYRMKIFNTKVRKQDEGTLYHITLIDVQDPWRLNTFKGAINATSNEALEQIAKACGMKFVGTPTNDRQVWYPMAETQALFARRIAAAGFVDAKSAMVLGLNLSGELRYINLNGVDLTKPVYEFCHGAQQGIWCTDWAVRSASGSANQGGGYATTAHQFSTVDGQRVSESKVQVQRKSNLMNMNTESKSAAGDGKILFSPIDAGNNHANSLKARNQNRRVTQLLSTSTSVVTPYDPNIDILEPVLFNNFIANKHDGKIEIDPKTSGVQVVAGKAIHIGADLMYNERYQFIREGHNMDNNTKVV